MAEHPPDAAAGRYRFGAALLDAAARRLQVGGQPVHLEPKAFDLLVFLIESRQRAVPKDELLERIWPGRVVVEGVLKRAVGLVRHALGDDAGEPRFIRTVHGIGYQFVAEVEVDESASARPPGAGRQSAAAWPLGMAAFAVVLLLALLGFANLWRDAGGAAEGAVRAVVLPFENAAGDPQLAWIERGLPALVAHALAEEPGLSLIAAETADRLAADLGLDFDTSGAGLEAARQLAGADYLLLGRVLGEPRAWRLELRIVGASGAESRRLFEAQELAQLATEAGHHELRLALLGARVGAATRDLSLDPFINETYARAQAARLGGDSAQARDLLAVVVRATPQDLHARLDLIEAEQRLGSRERVAELLEAVERAVAADAHSALAQRLAVFLGGVADAAGQRDQAWAHFEEAKEIAALRGDGLAEADALRQLGRLAAQGDDWDRAQALMGGALFRFERMGHEPGRAMTLGNLGLVYWRLGAVQESLRSYEAALAAFERLGRRDGAASMLGNLGNIHYELGDAEAALARYQQALSVQRALGNRASELHQLGNVARMQSILGRLEEAEASADAMRRAADELGEARPAANARMTLAELADKAGRFDEAVGWYGEAAERFAAMGMADYEQAARSKQVWVLAEAGRAEQARQLLERHREAIEADTSPYMRSQAIGATAALAVAEGQVDLALGLLEQGRELNLKAGLASQVQWFTGQLALVLLRSGRVERAEPWIGLMEGQEGSSADLQRLHARHAYELGEFADAVRHQERTRELAEGNWSAADEARLSRYREALALGRRVALGDEL